MRKQNVIQRIFFTHWLHDYVMRDKFDILHVIIYGAVLFWHTIYTRMHGKK